MSNNKVSEKAIWEGTISSDDNAQQAVSHIHTQPQMMFCYKCNNVIPSDSTFCPYCQIKLFAECPKCGAKYSSQYPACNKCGTNRKKYLQTQREEQVTPSRKNEINGHEYVDLGLPSGLKWATCNVGANKPEEFGDFFAWGENYTKNEYTSDNCKTIKKKLLGAIIERNGIFMDAPSSIWGRPWRMPTKTDILELLINCTWAWTIKNGIKGMNVTGKNGNSIFLPAAGWFDGKLHKSLDINGDFFGSYWSSTSSSFLGCAEGLGFGVDFNNKNTIRHDIYSSKCFIGSTIRPVTQ